MKKLIIILLVILISCEPAKRNWNQEKLNNKIEKNINKGMRYNHKCIEKEKELILRNIN